MRYLKLMIIFLLLLVGSSFIQQSFAASLSEASIAKELGWVRASDTRCGGYYVEAPFNYAKALVNNDQIHITSGQMLFAQHGTSVGQGRVTVTRFGQQVIANRAFINRDPLTSKLSSIDLIEDVVLREPNSLIFAKTGHIELKTQEKSLHDIFYRTAIYSNKNPAPKTPYRKEELQKIRQVSQLSAWGKADKFMQDELKIYQFENASYSTCPPESNTWRLKARGLKLNKITGRGSATHARLYVRNIPVFYTPYLNFPLDTRRQSGLLMPIVGTSSKNGGYLRLPFYWNLAPNYDSTITPVYLTKRGLQITDLFRYLTPTSEGEIFVAVLPNDRAFAELKSAYSAKYQIARDPYIQAGLKRLQQASDNRKSLVWQNKTRWNEHWSGKIDYNYVSDDYYLIDLGNNLNQVTQNQLLQQAQVNYQGVYWNFIGQVQGYQTLHPVDQTLTWNQYTRLPQLNLTGHYPNASGGIDYFINNEATHFTISNTPGSDIIKPIGNRLHTQPGISFPVNRPYFYAQPRLQYALTTYALNQVSSAQPTHPQRALPIFDLHSGLNFDRNIQVFRHSYRQTLEPQIYYTYVPYKNQDMLPVFDTTVNTLTYDELFTYNRFSGLDRIGDANQISYGVASRLLDEQTGSEKLRAGIGQIVYFKKRRVTLCPDNSCSDNPTAAENNTNKSPVSAMLTYTLNPNWKLTGNSIWNMQTNEIDNQTVSVHYQPEEKKIINLSYSFVRAGDQQPNDRLGSSSSNLKQTDLSAAWPISRDWSTVVRWTQNWNHHHFQNVLYGLQYDSCCWAVRFVTGRAFTNLSPNNTYQYNTEFYVQFALKGLGNYGNADPSQILSSSISGYQTQFGQDY